MPMTDEELEELKRSAKAAAEQAKVQKAALDRLSAEHANLQQAYVNDMNIVGRKLFNETQQPAPQPPMPNTEDPEELTPDRVRRIVQESIQQPAQQISGSIMELSRATARRDLPEFQRYEAEINNLVGRALQVNPGAAADSNLFRHAYDVVRLQHLDEIADEKAKARYRARLQEMGVEDDEVDEAAATAPETPAASTSPTAEQPRRSTFAEPPAATGGAGPRTALPARGRRTRLDDDQAYVAERLGLSHEVFDKYSNPNYTEDVFGFKDPQTGKRRATV